ncbi:hypothetical protein CCH79_00019837 [Gambusia affinis]|uniref:Uncharacterized protein n=1 Tax=Gambusia affinis TaxID=33528 RepID=A0A315W9X6_GAMAF|nr:hypothetical protein CCH79_00019837 [Gambusia affinis]
MAKRRVIRKAMKLFSIFIHPYRSQGELQPVAVVLQILHKAVHGPDGTDSVVLSCQVAAPLCTFLLSVSSEDQSICSVRVSVGLVVRPAAGQRGNVPWKLRGEDLDLGLGSEVNHQETLGVKHTMFWSVSSAWVGSEGFLLLMSGSVKESFHQC